MSESVDEGAIRWVKGREGMSGQSGGRDKGGKKETEEY